MTQSPSLRSDQKFKKKSFFFLQVSNSWKVTLQCLPGGGQVVARGEAVAFISALFDGKVSVANVEVSEGDVAATTIRLSHKVIGEEGQRFILRCQKDFLLGKLVSPC